VDGINGGRVEKEGKECAGNRLTLVALVLVKVVCELQLEVIFGDKVGHSETQVVVIVNQRVVDRRPVLVIQLDKATPVGAF
jgi:hypothetical protein